MIKLGSILYEVAKNKKAILFAGPAGAGKTSVIDYYIPPTFQEYILSSEKYSGKDIKEVQANLKADYQEALMRGRPIIMDVTGGKKSETTRKKNQLENAGYDVMMVMVYASPMATLERNKFRDKSLEPGVLLKSWKDVVNNIDAYRQSFGDSNFTIVNNNDQETASNRFSADSIEEYFKTSPRLITLSPEQKAILERDFQVLIDKVEQSKFTAFDELDSKLKTFLNAK
jgi:predicted kinase